MSFFTSVTRAEPEDTTEIMRLLVNTAEWLMRKGSNQWNALLRGEDSHNTPEAINNGDVYIFKQENHVAGMVILLKEPNAWDNQIWAERAGDNNAIYLHRLAISRKFAGKNVGRHIMEWVHSEAPSLLSKRVIRLDCLANNKVLNDFYKDLGYEYIGSATNSHGEFSKYEKRT